MIVQSFRRRSAFFQQLQAPVLNRSRILEYIHLPLAFWCGNLMWKRALHPLHNAHGNNANIKHTNHPCRGILHELTWFMWMHHYLVYFGSKFQPCFFYPFGHFNLWNCHSSRGCIILALHFWEIDLLAWQHLCFRTPCLFILDRLPSFEPLYKNKHFCLGKYFRHVECWHAS